MSSDGGSGREGTVGKKRSADRERPQSPVRKSSKHKSTVHENKREEKKKGNDGECVHPLLDPLLPEVVL